MIYVLTLIPLNGICRQSTMGSCGEGWSPLGSVGSAALNFFGSDGNSSGTAVTTADATAVTAGVNFRFLLNILVTSSRTVNLNLDGSEKETDRWRALNESKANLFLNDWIRLSSCFLCLSLLIGLQVMAVDTAFSKSDACLSVNVGFYRWRIIST